MEDRKRMKEGRKQIGRGKGGDGRGGREEGEKKGEGKGEGGAVLLFPAQKRLLRSCRFKTKPCMNTF